MLYDTTFRTCDHKINSSLVIFAQNRIQGATLFSIFVDKLPSTVIKPQNPDFHNEAVFPQNYPPPGRCLKVNNINLVQKRKSKCWWFIPESEGGELGVGLASLVGSWTTYFPASQNGQPRVHRMCNKRLINIHTHMWSFSEARRWGERWRSDFPLDFSASNRMLIRKVLEKIGYLFKKKSAMHSMKLLNSYFKTRMFTFPVGGYVMTWPGCQRTL